MNIIRSALPVSSSARLSKYNVTSFRLFSTSSCLLSHIGRTPISYPPDVTITHDPKPILNPKLKSEKDNTLLTISGPNGTHTLPIKPFIILNFSHPVLPSNPTSTQESKLTISVMDPLKKEQRIMWGTTRALIANYVTGVTEGHGVPLRLEGVGYRAAIEQDKLALRVGRTHPDILDIPEGVKCEVPKPTKILLSGSDKRIVMQFAAVIRSYRKPEPYNQKGIFVGDETIKKKIPKKK
ncbi:11333_t:CDS:1 [Paraglomus brasilianum]|uniref:11333_t:CDS:1 n=1 Tax=Paraglomus brasilianum TaxID=144538 RepID=A0A9N9CEL0_9GLOM|nr:11333_t:CDS:1 [Paraglomus brasilianum]